MRLTHYLALLWACLDMPDHTDLKLMSESGASMNVEPYTKIQIYSTNG